jgi:hypothetical protein
MQMDAERLLALVIATALLALLWRAAGRGVWPWLGLGVLPWLLGAHSQSPNRAGIERAGKLANRLCLAALYALALLAIVGG